MFSVEDDWMRASFSLVVSNIFGYRSVVVLDKDSNPEDPYRNISCISPIRSHMSDGEILFHRMPKFHIKYKNLDDMNSVGDKDNPIYEVYPPNGLPEESILDTIIDHFRDPDGEDFRISSSL